MSNNKQKKKMTLQQFGPWLEENAQAEYRRVNNRVDCVVSIDYIDPGKFVALYAVPSSSGLLIIELASSFDSKTEAWGALAGGSEAYPPIFFSDWVGQQYLTDREAKVERFVL
ncbi:MAG: hypothetical protein ABFC94_18930 [Syntrophomonas sp.]